MNVSSSTPNGHKLPYRPLDFIRRWLDHLNVCHPRLARLIIWLIPSQCPFARDIYVMGKRILHIPPLCKLNPFYDEFVALRFRALCYLVDDCGEDPAQFI